MEPTKTMNHQAILASFKLLQEFRTMSTTMLQEFRIGAVFFVDWSLKIGGCRFFLSHMVWDRLDPKWFHPKCIQVAWYFFPSTASLYREDSVQVRQLDYYEQNLERQRELNGLVISACW